MIDFNHYPSLATVGIHTRPPPSATIDAEPEIGAAVAGGPGDFSILPFAQIDHRPKFVTEDFDSLEPSPAVWRVKGLLPAVGVGVVAGPSMSGKSFLALHLLSAVCQGRPIFDLKTKACGGIYIAAEDAAGNRMRIKALRERVGPLNGAFRFLGQAPNLSDPEDIVGIRDMILENRVVMSQQGLELGVVIIDTLSASIPGADENSAKDMSPILAAVQALAVELRILVLLVGHTGKDESRGIRGWSGFKANSDCVIMVEPPDTGGVRIATADKVKNGPSGNRFAFRLDPVQVLQDEDGDWVTTCIVQEEEAPAAKRQKMGTKQEAGARILMTAFNLIYEAKSVEVWAPGAEGNVRGLNLADLRQQALKIGLGPTEPDYNDFPDDNSRKNARKSWLGQRQKVFERARDYLVSTGRMRIQDGLIWEVQAKS